MANDQAAHCSEPTQGGLVMRNITMEMDGSILVVRVDMSKSYGFSGSGKSAIIASTEGNQALTFPGCDGAKLGLNVYRKANGQPLVETEEAKF